MKICIFTNIGTHVFVLTSGDDIQFATTVPFSDPAWDFPRCLLQTRRNDAAICLEHSEARML